MVEEELQEKVQREELNVCKERSCIHAENLSFFAPGPPFGHSLPILSVFLSFHPVWYNEWMKEIPFSVNKGNVKKAKSLAGEGNCRLEKSWRSEKNCFEESSNEEHVIEVTLSFKLFSALTHDEKMEWIWKEISSLQGERRQKKCSSFHPHFLLQFVAERESIERDINNHFLPFLSKRLFKRKSFPIVIFIDEPSNLKHLNKDQRHPSSCPSFCSLKRLNHES